MHGTLDLSLLFFPPKKKSSRELLLLRALKVRCVLHYITNKTDRFIALYLHILLSYISAGFELG